MHRAQLLVFALFFLAAHAISSPNSIWFSGGFGGANSENARIVKRTGMGLRFNYLLLQTRGIFLEEITASSIKRTPFEQQIDAGILCGAAFNVYNIVEFYVSTGGAFVYDLRRTDIVKYEYYYESVPTRTFGVPIEIEINFLLTNFLGFGGALIANINNASSYIGGLATIKLGKVKSRRE